MLAKIVGFLTRNGKQLAGTDKAGNAYFRQSQTVDGAGNVVSSLTEPHGARSSHSSIFSTILFCVVSVTNRKLQEKWLRMDPDPPFSTDGSAAVTNSYCSSQARCCPEEEDSFTHLEFLLLDRDCHLSCCKC
jgi:hypothetical protein